MANIQQECAQDFITKHKLVTLDDYIYSVAHDTWEKGVETLVSQVPTLRDNMIALARFRINGDDGNDLHGALGLHPGRYQATGAPASGD